MRALIELAAEATEFAGVAVIVVGILAVTVRAGVHLLRRSPSSEVYDAYREAVGRSILLGLEFLVAADIIQTILIRPSLENAASLAVIVLIRTLLSFSLETEIEGRLPWRRAEVQEPSSGGT